MTTSQQAYREGEYVKSFEQSIANSPKSDSDEDVIQDFYNQHPEYSDCVANTNLLLDNLHGDDVNVSNLEDVAKAVGKTLAKGEKQ